MAWVLYFMPIWYIIFITQKLDATAKNRFQILILHPKKHIFREKNIHFFQSLFTRQISLFQVSVYIGGYIGSFHLEDITQVLFISSSIRDIIILVLILKFFIFIVFEK